MDVGWNKRFWIAVVAVSVTIVDVVLADNFGNHGRIVKTEEVPATVLSSNAHRGKTRYLLKFPDGRTRQLPGPTLPLHPTGSTLAVEVDHFADGATEFRIPTPPY